MYSMRTSCTGGARLIETVALLIALAAESSAQAAGGISVTQTAPGYVADATLAVTCTIAFDAARQVQSLLWMPALPSGWLGGNRIAIHGTSGPLGVAASHGCVRAADADVRALVRSVPLGTPVFIRS